jgi:hypothetical protein
MCCFSGKVQKVADTSIFARAIEGGRQYLVYSMFLKADSDLAMILPLPTPKKSNEDAVKFISLQKYPEFFADMLKGFPTRGAHSNTKSKGDKGEEKPKLKVVEVGSFEASFVPTVKDFDRLDEKFVLPKGTWDELPTYKDYGFAVFKLKKGEKKIHPMAFDFPRADKKKLFFPTVHIHDGKVHKTATFDHALYCQTSGEDISDWAESPGHPASFMQVDKCQGIVVKNAHVYQKLMKGRKTNQDTWLV